MVSVSVSILNSSLHPSITPSITKKMTRARRGHRVKDTSKSRIESGCDILRALSSTRAWQQKTGCRTKPVSKCNPEKKTVREKGCKQELPATRVYPNNKCIRYHKQTSNMPHHRHMQKKRGEKKETHLSTTPSSPYPSQPINPAPISFCAINVLANSSPPRSAASIQ